MTGRAWLRPSHRLLGAVEGALFHEVGDPLRALAPLAALYGAASAARGGLAHRWRIRLSAPVVSVGALAVGGSGKTSLVRWLGAMLREAGHRPAVLTRGYGWVRASDRPRALLPEGEAGAEPAAVGPYATAERSVPDEAALFLRDGLPVGAHPVRARAAAELVRRGAAPDVWLLDDGFQHRRLERALDLAVVSRRDLAAPRRPLPAGPLRERWSALRRADRIAITGLSSREADELAGRDPADLGLPAEQPPVLAGLGFVALVPLEAWSRGESHPVAAPAGDVVAFSGIADPAGFERLLAAAGLSPVRHLVFPDHHRYAGGDLRRLRAFAPGATLVTTEKDAARVPAGTLEGTCLVACAALRVWRGEADLGRDLSRLFPDVP